MFKRSIILLACIIGMAATAVHAQMTVEDAQRLMQQRKAQRDAAATQPSTLTAAEVQELRDEIAMLKEENAKLRAQLLAIGVQQAAPASANAPPAAEKPDKNGVIVRKVAIGMTVDQVNKTAGSQGVLASQDATGTIYKWYVPETLQITDGANEPTGGFGEYEFDGTFVDGKLASFTRAFIPGSTQNGAGGERAPGG